MPSPAMFSKHLLSLFLLSLTLKTTSLSSDPNLSFTGFKTANIFLDGIAKVTPNGLLRLTNDSRVQMGHAFYPNPVAFKAFPNATVSSFSTTFVFAIRSEFATLSGQGIAFVISPSRGLPGALPSQYLGLFNYSSNGNDTNHVAAIELDTIQSSEFSDINDNHVGIDINGLKSEVAASAGYYDDKTGAFWNLTLISGQPMKVWIEYDGVTKRIDVTLAPVNVEKPKKVLVSLVRDLSPILHETMFVGFSSSTGSLLTSHYVLGWSFKMNGQAQELKISELPDLPRIGHKQKSNFLTIGLPTVSLVLAALATCVVVVGFLFTIKYFCARKHI